MKQWTGNERKNTKRLTRAKYNNTVVTLFKATEGIRRKIFVLNGSFFFLLDPKRKESSSIFMQIIIRWICILNIRASKFLNCSKIIISGFFKKCSHRKSIAWPDFNLNRTMNNKIHLTVSFFCFFFRSSHTPTDLLPLLLLRCRWKFRPFTRKIFIWELCTNSFLLCFLDKGHSRMMFLLNALNPWRNFRFLLENIFQLFDCRQICFIKFKIIFLWRQTSKKVIRETELFILHNTSFKNFISSYFSSSSRLYDVY